MKFVRFFHPSDASAPGEVYGILEEAGGCEQIRRIQGNPVSGYTLCRQVYRPEEVTLRAPVLPSKVIAVGVNYRAHAEEFRKAPPEEPLLFLKPPSAIIGPEEAIRYPQESSRVDLEAELAVVIKNTVRRITPEAAREAVLGFTCFNDVTARDLQKRDGQWSRAKGFDTFAPIGPCITTGISPENLQIQSRLNGKLMQSARTSEMIFDVYTLVSFISQVMTLLPGDVIATGTPAGVAPLQDGDVVEVSIEGIGTLKNIVSCYP